MDIEQASAVLGGLTPQRFMKRCWHKKPLVVRGAWPQGVPAVDRTRLFAWAASDDVESRLIQRRNGGWTMRQGPFTRRQLPPLGRREWTLLVQGVDLLADEAHALLRQFRFAPDARLDDLMVSWASDGGGVGPHFDSYDVFLLQLHGQRRWRIGRLADPTLMPGLPVKILARFEPEEEHLLGPGDMLYLPPRWAHDGVAVGKASRRPSVSALRPGMSLHPKCCSGCSMAWRTTRPARSTATRRSLATSTPAAVPTNLAAFAADAVARLLAEPRALACALGEWLSEPKSHVFYDQAAFLDRRAGIRLDRRTRMLYDEHHVFINGESFVASGRDAVLLRRLADERQLPPAHALALSADAWGLMEGWAEDGWLLSGVEST